MTKNALLVFVILIFIVGIIAVIIYSSPSSPSTTAVNTSPQESQSSLPMVAATVIYTDSGFSPESVTIKSGESVTWINNSSDRMWVATDPHPTHTDLPGFDERTFANPGSTWTYTFTAPGVHAYHNHANAAMRGTVTVQ